MDILCHVCGDKASGKHYGVPSCDGCRGFFKRSIRRNLEYVCKEGGKCIIDVTRRNQCQACRFTKCIQANMKREAVQHERAPRSLITPYEDTTFRWSPSVTKIGAPFQYSSFIASQYPNSISVSGLSHGGPSVERKHFSNDNEVTSTEEVYGQSESYEDKYKRCSIGYAMRRDIHESAFRLLLLAIKWAQSIPSFSQFTEKDQGILLIESWNDLFILNAIQWSISLEDDILNDSICSNDDIKEFQTNLRLLVGRFSSLQTDYTEFVYLKALILFKPEAKGLHDKLHAELLQDQTQLMLHEYCFLRHHARFGKLLLLLSSVTSFDKRKIEKLLFNNQSMSELLKHMCVLNNICYLNK